jgi:hemerythrin-like metal-binding protein|tara:strand:- start:71 stop:472 length:402 start_codon:yes stop_codon:yes gene_type:complete
MIEWNDKFSVNVSIIDEEHKKLIDIINKAFVAKQHGSNPEEILEILNDMVEYAQKHFKTEETYMIEFNYPEYQDHRKEHHAFCIRTLSYHTSVTLGEYQDANEVLEYVKQWWVNHIQKTDKRYTSCFKKHGLK